MSREYIVIIVDEPTDGHDVDGESARVFMRFTEPPSDEFLLRIAKENLGKRVYSLLGASSWTSVP